MSAARSIGRGLVAASFGLSAALYTRLPDAFPTHFDLAGHANGFIAKPLGPFVLPLISLVAYAIIGAVVRRQRSAAVLHVVPTAFAALFFAIHAVAVRAALDDTTDVTRWILIAISGFITVFGNYLGKLRRNRWVGIRTPWTLADDEVWLRTHRIGGWMFVAGGTLGLVAALAGARAAVVLGVLVVTALVPAAASYVIFRRVAAQHSTRSP
ncbi:MAG TPA: SdpI family protein [Kofleriaceae bacterium]|nr:SdpI family protein [Kofleriaceae bacterium]